MHYKSCDTYNICFNQQVIKFKLNYFNASRNNVQHLNFINNFHKTYGNYPFKSFIISHMNKSLLFGSFFVNHLA